MKKGFEGGWSPEGGVWMLPWLPYISKAEEEL